MARIGARAGCQTRADRRNGLLHSKGQPDYAKTPPIRGANLRGANLTGGELGRTKPVRQSPVAAIDAQFAVHGSQLVFYRVDTLVQPRGDVLIAATRRR